ncbi:MAG: hypothetical protein M1281_10785 [Chloroflexi bacterium]|nr:hypothetical protein [Chloroflexota bacterium]
MNLTFPPKTLSVSILVIFFLSSLVISLAQQKTIPVTREIPFNMDPRGNKNPSPLAALPLQANPAKNEKPNALVAVSVPTVLDLPVEQQPKDSPVYVSTKPGTLTQFGMASQYGTIGLLAHNNLAGSSFFHLKIHEIVTLIYGNGQSKTFEVSSIKQYQALNPDSPYSDFIDLATPDVKLTSAEVFNKIYRGSNQVVFQTCIAQNGDPSWGRLFITARQLSPDLDGNAYWHRLWRNAFIN